MSALRHERTAETGAAAAAGLALGASAVVAGTSHSQLLKLALVAEIAVVLALAVGDVRRLLLIAVIFDIPLQWEKNFGWNASAANLGALGGLDISVTTIALLGLYVLWARERGLPGTNSPRARWKAAAPLVAYVAVETLSLVVAHDRLLGVYEVALLAQTLLLFVYVASTVRRREEVRMIAVALVASLLVESLLIIALRVTGVSVSFAGLHSHTDPTTSTSDLRLGGTIGAPNTAAAFLCILIPLAAGLLMSPASRALRRLCVAASVIGTAALIMTESRGGWMSLVISGLILAVVAVRRGLLPLRALVCVLIVIVVVLVPFWGTISHRVSTNDNGSAASRLSLATLASHMIEDHPVLGVGVNNVGLNVPNYAGPQFDGTFVYTVHNKYLLVWSEAGILALGAFLWFLAATIRSGWRGSRARDPVLSPVALGLTAGVIGQLAHMAVDLFQSRPQVQLLWFVAAVLAATQAILERERPRGYGPRVSRVSP
jgi:O-antigen ligase